MNIAVLALWAEGPVDLWHHSVSAISFYTSETVQDIVNKFGVDVSRDTATMHNIFLDRSEGPEINAGWDGSCVSATHDRFSQGQRRVTRLKIDIGK